MGLFGEGKKDRSRRLGIATASLLAEAARSGDTERVGQLIFGPETTDEGVMRALVLFIHLAHDHPEVIEMLRQTAMEMPDSASTAFRTGIRCAEIGDSTSFQGGTPVGQGLFISVIARAVALSDSAMQDLANLRQM